MESTLLHIDLVVPVYNEMDAIRTFHSVLTSTIEDLPYAFKIYYINDGSQDQTGEILEEIARGDHRVFIVELSRNFGHQAALTAGMDLANGDYVISLDGDGQHPPERIGEMVGLAVQQGYDIVIMQRTAEFNSNSFKNRTSNLFYQIINRIGETRIVPGAADFRLMSHNVILALRSMPEYSRFIRGMVNWMGYRTVILPYDQPPRLAGNSKYSLPKMLRLATNAIFSFSLVPLYIAISIGVIFLILAFLEAVYVISLWVSGSQATLAPGWSSLMFMLLCVGGSVMISMGLIGIYIGYIFQEVKRRPIYLIRRTWSNIEGAWKGSDSSSPH